MTMTLTIRPPFDTVPQILFRPWFAAAKSSYNVHRRKSSTYSADQSSASSRIQTHLAPASANALRTEGDGLERLPTTSIVRNLLLGTIFSYPILANPGFRVLRKIANSKSSLLNADRNPVLQSVLKPLFYDQFCAGRNSVEIRRTREYIKRMGFSGVILCYGKEAQISKSGTATSTGVDLGFQRDAEIEHFLRGNLETLDMVDSGDWLGMKFTGAGAVVTEALLHNRDPPPAFVAALDAICQKAAAKNCRLWVDAEQQVLQTAIDRWTVDLMRKYNEDGKAVVYNTLQSYLKSSRNKLEEQLAIANREGWTLCIKLVRGAYIDNDKRELIHDTKADTDASYNGIVRDLLTGANLGFPNGNFPKNFRLFLAGHNQDSISAAWNLVQSLNKQNRLRTVPDFGQLQGMGDVVSCKYLKHGEELRATDGNAVVPRLYKCLTWGTIEECMQYLFRRAVENSGGADRLRDGLAVYRAELRRRVWNAVTLRHGTV